MKEDKLLFVEFRTQSHLMDMDGTSDTKPTIEEIQEYGLKNGWEIFNINIIFDTMMGFYRFNGDIEPKLPTLF